ncbi:MAG: pantoate--beta-alanine ligase [Methylophaga sp.]|nr:MAG: pantoate--beta-alanine ligase [Methylophaga sp.]
MKKITTVTELRQQITQWKKAGQRVALVPTMGNLHQGHLSLVETAKQIADKVIVSLFVNPLQFDDKTDLSAYPRTLDADIEQLISVECAGVFIPTVQTMYPEGMDGQAKITVPAIDDKLCGQARPGHFDGVATVVAKLFNMVQPDVAVFGEKDYQQLLLIKKMVIDLNFATEIIGAATFREKNGLAMSSRNQYLTEQQRQQAASLYRILNDIKIKLIKGETDFSKLEQQAIAELKQLGFEPDYVDIRHAGNLTPAKSSDKALRVLLAARLGRARLIDNIACDLD